MAVLPPRVMSGRSISRRCTFQNRVLGDVSISWQAFILNENFQRFFEVVAASLAPRGQVPACTSICRVVWPWSWIGIFSYSERSQRFLLGCERTAGCSVGDGDRSARCARDAEQKAAGVHNGPATFTIAGRRGVHAGHDHASCAGGGDDGADRVAYAE